MRYTDADAFLAAAEPLMARNPAVRAFVTIWAHGWRGDAGAGTGDYIATYSGAGTHGVALQRDGPLVVLNSGAAAAHAFAHALADVAREVPSVIGEQPACEAFAAAWGQRTGCGWRTAMHMRHHVLTTLQPTTPAPGFMRTAEERDRAWLVDGAHAFAREAQLIDTPQQVQRSTERRIARDGFRIWEDGVPVAFAGWSNAGSDARIAPVYTLPQWRGRGYGTSLVAALVGERLDAGAGHVFLVTDLANPTSNALYARIGFRPVSDEVRLDFIPAP